MPRVSVLLTCFNHLRFIEECVQSVAAQTFTDWEIVAIDDGSTDGTREWLSACPVPMKRIFNESNLGSYASLNRALAASEGEFIAVLNDDDVWLPEKLSLQVQAMDADARVGLVHTFGRFVDDDTVAMTDPEPLGFPFPRTGDGDVLASLVEFNKVINSASLVRRSVIDKVGAWDPSYYGCGDWHLWLRVARDSEVRYLQDELVLYRIHRHQASRNSARMNDDSRRIREWIATWDTKFLLDRPGMPQALALNWAALGTERMWAGQKAEARTAYRHSIQLDPSRWQSRLRLLATYLPSKVFRALG